MSDPDQFDRFVAAQEPLWRRVRAELAAGRKETHWMWFVFPQIAGLGRSAMARRYALGSVAEARAYMAHPVLGPRLLEAARLATAAEGTAREVFGAPDDLKLRSSLTLFLLADPDDADLRAALERFFDGEMDGATLALAGGGRAG